MLVCECLPGESHEQRSLVGYSPWDCKELDKPMVRQLESQPGKVQRKGQMRLRSWWEVGSQVGKAGA